MLHLSFLILALPVLIGSTFSCRAAAAYMDVLEQFRRYAPDEFANLLDRRRPPLVDKQMAAMIVAGLPKEGEVTRLTLSEQQKLRSATAVLRLHDREAVYLMKVVDSPQARVGLHARFIVLITNTALRLLSQAQLQALVAHEIGHEYVWDEYERASTNRSWRQVRSLELFCDGFAMVTLARVGADPAALIQALRLLDAWDRDNGLSWEHNSHPSLPERTEFARKISIWLNGRRSLLSREAASLAPR